MKRSAINPHRSGVNSTGNNNNNVVNIIKIIFITAIFCLSAIIFFSFGSIQVTSAQQQQEKNNNDNTNNNIPNFSLSTFSTAIGTGAAATGVIVTVPGFLKTRNQSKYLSIYLLKVHDTYHEILHKLTKGQANNEKQEYFERLDSLRREVIWLLHRRDINENQYKMLDDKIVEYLNKINDLK